MISPQDVKRLTASNDRHVLTVYFSTSPDLPRTGYAARLRSLLREVEPLVSSEDRKQYEQVVAKVTNFVGQYRPTGNSFLVFAGPKSWDEYSSRVPVRDEVWWGRPNTAQLLWLLEEFRPYGVLIAGIEHVRFLAVRMNALEAFQEFHAEIDTSQWRERRVGTKGRGAVQKGGRSVEAFDQRYMEHVRRFWKTLHKPLAELVERYHIRRLALAGTKSVLPDFARSLPAAIGKMVVAQLNLETFTTPTDAVQRVFPEVAALEAKREQATVNELLAAAGISKRAAVGIDPVLKHLQAGRTSRLVVVKGLDAEVSRCNKCQQVSGLANGQCPRCNSADLGRVKLAGVLPRLVLEHGLPVEVIRSQVGTELARSGGVGAFLRF